MNVISNVSDPDPEIWIHMEHDFGTESGSPFRNTVPPKGVCCPN